MHKQLKHTFLSLVATALLVDITVLAQEDGTAPDSPPAWSAQEDHANMLMQLGITVLRPGPSGQEDAPNAANYDEALANHYPDWPDLLTLNNGEPVTDAESWRQRRRPEIVAAFEREVVGRIPDGVPAVDWVVTESGTGMIGGHPVSGRRLIGQVDNSAWSQIEVGIEFTLVLPEEVNGPVPVMILFRGGSLDQALGNEPIRRFGPQGDDPPEIEQLVAAGWGFAFLNPGSIQADNGAGLTRGIIGLVNKGQPRQPEDWGALRAWGWGASQALTWLESEPAVDASRVGIEGVSRYGKAALVTMAFDERFAVVLVGSSGEGGASPYRRNFGEMVENLSGSGQYHWMAGSFLKYAAEEATFGRMDADDLPVDAHFLIALCAPRPTFISYGIPEQGDALWLDQQGSYMATVAADEVFELLGVRGLDTGEHYQTATMPPVNQGLLEGTLAWRQHDGGHTDAPNWRHFIPWAAREMGFSVSGVARQTGPGWIAGDHHIHSRFSYGWDREQSPPAPILGGDAIYPTPMNALMARHHGLDWMVTTDHGGPNHSQLNLEQAYPELQRSREVVPDIIQFYGMEFDTPGADHSSIIIPHTHDEAERLHSIESDYSRLEPWPADPEWNQESRMLDALRFMNTFPEKPLVIAHHPSRSASAEGEYGLYEPSELRNWNDTAPDIAVGMEGAPGHQAAALAPDGSLMEEARARGYYFNHPTLGGFDQMTAIVGGFWDSMLGEGRDWWITANSDSHIHYTEGGADFWPGEYAKTYVWAEKNHDAILDGIRAGRVFVTTGDLISALDVAASQGEASAMIGGSLHIDEGSDVEVRIRFLDPEKPNHNGDNPQVHRVDLIMGDITGPAADTATDHHQSARVVARFTEDDWAQAGDYREIVYRLENVRHDQYLRVRGTNTEALEPGLDERGADPWQDLWFYSNPVRIRTGHQH